MKSLAEREETEVGVRGTEKRWHRGYGVRVENKLSVRMVAQKVKNDEHSHLSTR